MDVQFKHHPKLHQTNFVLPAHKKDEKSGSTNLATKQGHVHSDRTLLATFRYIVVRLYNRPKMLQVVAFLDEGTTSTMVNRNIIEFLGIQADKKQDLLLKWTGGVSRVEEDSQLVSLEIYGTEPRSRKYVLSNVRTVTDLDLDKKYMDVNALLREFHYLRHIPVCSYNNTAAQTIGLDNWKLGIPLKIVDRGCDEPVATKTRLEWEVHGEKVPVSIAKINRHTKLIEYDKADDELHNLVLCFSSLENFGVKILENTLDSKKNIR